MDCIDTCHKNAIAYELRPKTRKPAKEEKRESGREENPAGLSRRRFSVAYGVFAAHTHSVHRRSSPTAGWPSSNRKKFPAVRRRSSRPRREPAQHGAPLHRLPALRGRLSQRRVAALGKTHVPDAARNVLRTRLLPPRMHEVLRGLPRRSDPPRDGGREVVRADRPCRLDTCQLRAPDRRRRLRQLRPPLPSEAITMVPSDTADPDSRRFRSSTPSAASAAAPAKTSVRHARSARSTSKGTNATEPFNPETHGDQR